MRKHILAFAILTMAGGGAFAVTLSPQAALDRALGQRTVSLRTASSVTSSPQLVYTGYENSQPVVYLFDRGTDSGYLAVSADDSSVPLLGYSDTGSLPASGESLPREMLYWLGQLGRQVSVNALRATTYVEDPGATRAEKAAIAPMIETRWNQDAPYYNDCPTIGSQHCYTGCVATAMAQVLRYYKYPAKGAGTHSYTWTYTENGVDQSKSMSFDYGTTTFDWSLMPDRYDSSSTEAEKAEVAKLMYACGVSVDMDYGTSGSGAVSFNMVRALIENFSYGKGIKYLMRDYYGIDEWNDIVYQNLVDYGPVLYGGQSNDGGHQFICDGYADGYFHFNWGWGGMSDGYFLLTALNPESQGIGGSTSGYDFDQDILTCLSPSADSQTPAVQLYWSGDFSIPVTSADLGTTISFSGTYFSYSYGTIDGANLGLQLVPAAGGDPIFLSSITINGLKSEYGGNISGTVTLPSDLAEGVYTVRPAVKDSEGNVSPIPVDLQNRGSYTMTVTGTTATFSAVNPASLSAADFTPVSDIYLNTDFKVTATLTNTSATQEFTGNLIVGLVQDGSIVAAGTKMAVDILPGESLAWQYEATMAATDSSNTPAAGTYDMYLMQLDSDGDAMPLAGPISVTLHDESPATLKVEDLKIADNQSLDKITATGTLQCTAGYFAGSLSLIIFPGDGGDELASYNSNFVAVGAPATSTAAAVRTRADDGTTPIEYQFSFPSGEPDTYYLALMYYKGNFISNRVRFKTAAATGLPEIQTESVGETPADYYTLQGVKVQNPDHGIYIRVANGKAAKVRL